MGMCVAEVRPLTAEQAAGAKVVLAANHRRTYRSRRSSGDGCPYLARRIRGGCGTGGQIMLAPWIGSCIRSFFPRPPRSFQPSAAQIANSSAISPPSPNVGWAMTMPDGEITLPCSLTQNERSPLLLRRVLVARLAGPGSRSVSAGRYRSRSREEHVVCAFRTRHDRLCQSLTTGGGN